MKKSSKRSLWYKLLLFVFILTLIGFVHTFYLWLTAVSVGSELGSGTGSLVGKAIGSYNGMIDGTKDGKEAGLSAEDTKADIATQLQQVNNLEVLVASVKLEDYHDIGPEGDEKYAALYLVNGNVVFTVDMSQATITSKSGNLHIILPNPVGELYIDQSSIDKAAEYQKTKFSGNAKDGFDAYLNTMKKVQDASEETLNNYDILLDSAKQAAKRQVSLLALAASESYSEITVEFAE